MIIWNVLICLIYLQLSFINFGACFISDDDDVVDSSKTPIELSLNKKASKNKYVYEKSGNNGVYTTFDGYAFSSVKLPGSCAKSEVVWEATEKYEYANKVIADETVPDIRFVKIFEVNGDRKLVIRDHSNKWTEYDSHDKVPIVFNLNILNDFNSDQQCSGDLRRYKAKEYCHYNEIVETVRSNNNTVWKANNDHDCAWKIVANGKYNITNTNKLSVFLESGEIIHFLKIRGNWEITTAQLILNLKIRQPTFEFSYSINGNTEIFTARYNFVFVVVKLGNSIIWKSKNESDFVKKAAIILNKDHSIPDTALLFLANGIIKHLTVLDTDWYEFDPSIVLDIDEKCSKNEYRYFKHNRAEHFIPVGRLLFRGVKTTKGLLHTSDVDIWTGKDEGHYAKSVMIIHSGKQMYMVLLLANERFVIFFKSDGVKTWTEYTHYPLVIGELKLLGYDLTSYKPVQKDKPKTVSEISLPETVPETGLRSRNLIDLDISKMYNISGYTIAYSDNKVIFTARFQYLFKLVLLGNEILWEPGANGEFPYKVIYKEIDNRPKIKVYFPDVNGIAPQPKPRLNFDPSKIEVQVVNFKAGDKKVADELSHKSNTRFSWSISQPLTHLNHKPP